MDHSLTEIFVVPTGNTLPTTGSTNNLTVYTSGATTTGQFGIFLPDNTPATVANVGMAKYIYVAQPRNIASAAEGTRTSDRIYADNILEWYKVTGSMSQNTQVTQVSALTATCNQDVSITIRIDGFYVEAAYRNMLTRSVMITTPCCNCGSNPCDGLTAANYQLVMLQLATAINQDTILNQYVTAGVNGTGVSTTIYIQALALQTYGQGTSVDLTNYPYQFDRISFRTFVMTGPELTTDYEVDDICNLAATVTVLQRSSYPTATPYEVQQLEKDWFSYNAQFKDIFSNVNYNGEFQTYVDQFTTAYDLYYIKFARKNQPGWNVGVGFQSQDETVVLAFVQGDSSESPAVAILSAFLGTPDNETATPSTTSTYTTSSTTTTTTTGQFP